MIAYIKGDIEVMGDDYIIIDNNGIGYLINMPLSDIEKLKNQRENVKINTYQYVREDAIGLFGFLSTEGLNMFKMLINVSGVGPKAALSILSSVSPSNLILSIIMGDEKTLCRAQGIGKKLAQRIILELKDKFKDYDLTQKGKNDNNDYAENDGMEALAALMALGYTRQEAASAIKQVDDGTLGIEEIVKRSLKFLMRG
ncbi:Holliday junction DNA helicase subunit RuvA [Caloramator quimbayensis]|uniref:Holliday junction branch migration complex subunit RuvA n=1 Tax=Caloramator quimbayensis TaxID=1147123 RepID=A0A1T4WUJ1_9CLOT|nr:Holliday junction branch migration protein RuvA [Caloramator quimbayensis]SKA80996.1 Holliday junction DNA helicase subunit RuvA [Caloramator quimbayensis]